MKRQYMICNKAGTNECPWSGCYRAEEHIQKNACGSEGYCWRSEDPAFRVQCVPVKGRVAP